MSADWRIRAAQEAVGVLRRRLLHDDGVEYDPSVAADPFAIAKAYLDCQIVYLPELTDRRALEYLEREWRIDISDEKPKDEPLAGGLYVVGSGSHSWIFVEQNDLLPRQRWSVAHELGHLVREAWPSIEQARASLGVLVGTGAGRLMRFGRCGAPAAVVDGRVSPDRVPRRGPLTAADKRELDAHDFAAELLTPYDGVKSLVGQAGRGRGVRTNQDLQELIRAVERRYDVSREAATRRLREDLEIRPLSDEPNGDLFA
jgi:hypothetical protein